jgi:hypothetical protein
VIAMSARQIEAVDPSIADDGKYAAGPADQRLVIARELAWISAAIEDARRGRDDWNELMVSWLWEITAEVSAASGQRTWPDRVRLLHPRPR